MAAISGSRFQVNVPLASLPSQGFDPTNYQFNLWPHDAAVAGTAAISDFAPDATNFAVPEPWTTSLLATGLSVLGLLHRRGTRLA